MSHLFLHDNLVSNDYSASFTMVTGAENQQFPMTNLLDPATTKVFRANVVATVVEFYVDMTTSRTADTVAVVGSSLDGLGVTAMSIFGSATTDFSGSSEIVLDMSSEFNFGFKEFTSVSYRYWKVKVTATGSYAELSNIFIGEATSLGSNQGISQDSFNFVNRSNAKISKNRYGQKFVTKYNTLQDLNGQIKFLTTTEKNTLEDIARDRGTLEPLFFILDPDSNLGTNSKYRYSGMYYFNSDPVFSSINGLLFNTSLSFREAG